MKGGRVTKEKRKEKRRGDKDKGVKGRRGGEEERRGEGKGQEQRKGSSDDVRGMACSDW